jgi:arginase
MGPSAVRVAGLESKLEALGYRVKDGGNVSVAVLETRPEGDPRAKYLAEITETCTKEAELVVKTLESGHIPIVLGGDHSIAAGTVSGVAEYYRRQNQKIGLIWIDAHSDINTPDSSPSGNVHGMPLGAIMALWDSPLANLYNFSPKVKPDNCVLVGIRDVDSNERDNIKRSGVRTPVWGGATYREGHLAMEIIADHGRMLSFEIVEVNPVLDERNQTAELAVELALSAFGKKIL